MSEQKLLPFKCVTIIGVGLIGGSLALAIKNRFPAVHITGVDEPQILKRALKRNAIDIAEHSVEQAVRTADLVIIAVPVFAIAKLLPIVAKNIAPHTIVTDTGSVKQAIVEKAKILFPNGRFIGGHPMAGSEFSGIDAAHPLLFQNAIYILTPTSKTNNKSLQAVAKFFNSLDARILTIDPATHEQYYCRCQPSSTTCCGRSDEHGWQKTSEFTGASFTCCRRFWGHDAYCIE